MAGKRAATDGLKRRSQRLKLETFSRLTVCVKAYPHTNPYPHTNQRYEWKILQPARPFPGRQQ